MLTPIIGVSGEDYPTPEPPARQTLTAHADQGAQGRRGVAVPCAACADGGRSSQRAGGGGGV